MYQKKRSTTLSKLRTVKRSPKGTRAWLVGGIRIQRTLDPISFRNSNTVCFKTLTQVGMLLVQGGSCVGTETIRSEKIL